MEFVESIYLFQLRCRHNYEATLFVVRCCTFTAEINGMDVFMLERTFSKVHSKHSGVEKKMEVKTENLRKGDC